MTPSISSAQPPTQAGEPVRQLHWRDTLRFKIVVLLAGSMIVFLALLLFPVRQIFLNSFSDLERQNTAVDLTRALNLINNEREFQQKMIIEYGAWDDTYNFVDQPDQSYIEDNYANLSFANRRSNLVLLLNADRRLMFGRNVDLSSQQELPLPPNIERLYASDSTLLNFTRLDQSNSEIVRVGDQILLINAFQILTSQFAGPSHGTIIFGRTLDPATIAEYSEVAQLPLEIYPPDDPKLLAELPAPLSSIFGQQSQYIHPLSATTIAGYVALRGLDDQPAAILRVAKPRTIYQREQIGLYSIAVAAAGCGVLLLLLLLLLLDRVIVARLALLNANLAQIGAGGDRSGRVLVHGRDELGQLALAINDSLSALEQAEAERQRASAQAQQLNRRFIATVSHELRTPLTPIQGYLDLLTLGIAGTLSAEQSDIIRIIKGSVDRMGALVEDVLMVSSIDSKGVVLHLVPTELKPVIAEAVEIFQITSSQKQIALTVEIADDLPAVVADKRRMHQIIWNLLSNAVKYTEAGGRIWVRARLRDQHSAEVHVQDTGVGMTEDQLQRLFTPFYRADNPLSVAAGGTGLGLVIAHNLVELHGGTIQVTSAPRAGSTFTFTLPLAQPEA